jgi:cation diffusion facilitator family transporter
MASRLQRSLRATFIGMVTNLVLAAGKLAAGIFGHSHALVADAVESFADLFGSLIVWRGVVVAAEPADEDHPYGHGKAEPLAAAAVATMMLLAAGWIVIEAVHGLSESRPAPEWFTLFVLAGVVLVKEGLFHFVLREAAFVHSSAVQADAWHHRSDAITSLAAAIGISISIFAGIHSADDVAAIFAAAIIAWNGWRLLRPAAGELMDQAPDRRIIERIRQIAETTPGIARVEKCFVRKMGHQLYAEMHIEVDPQMTVLRSHELAHEAKDKIRAAIPRVSDVLIHIEPLGIAAKKKL